MADSSDPIFVLMHDIVALSFRRPLSYLILHCIGRCAHSIHPSIDSVTCIVPILSHRSHAFDDTLRYFLTTVQKSVACNLGWRLLCDQEKRLTLVLKNTAPICPLRARDALSKHHLGLTARHMRPGSAVCGTWRVQVAATSGQLLLLTPAYARRNPVWTRLPHDGVINQTVTRMHSL